MSTELSASQLIRIAEEFGTPVYVYHAERIGEQYSKLKHAFRSFDSRIFYAAKSLTNINVLKHIHSLALHSIA